MIAKRMFSNSSDINMLFSLLRICLYSYEVECNLLSAYADIS